MFFASKILDLNTWLLDPGTQILDLGSQILDQGTWIPPVHVAAYLGSVQLGRLGCKDGGGGEGQVKANHGFGTDPQQSDGADDQIDHTATP